MWIFLNPSIRAARVAPAVFARRLSYFPYRQSFVKLGAVRRVDCQNKVPSFLSRMEAVLQSHKDISGDSSFICRVGLMRNTEAAGSGGDSLKIVDADITSPYTSILRKSQLSVSVEPPPEVEDAAADNNSRGTRPSPGTRYQPNSETLEERVIRLGDQIKRYDRVQIGQLKVLLGEARKIDTLDDPVALLLLRCTGSILAREQPAVRQELFLQAWDLVKSRASLNTSHYNAAMRVMIENEEEFDPTQFLAEMDQSPTTKPNRVTYQVMVAKYCASGDTDAAFKIINHMKTTGMPVNEYIFSSLIKAFVKNGEPEQAREVMNNMRSASLEPSDITYRAILTAYAELGNLDAIHQTLAEAKKDDVLIKAGVIPELGTTAVLSGHNDLLEPILDLLSSQGRYNLNLSNCADKLVSYGHDEEAYLMISKMQFTQVQEPGQLGHGKALIGAMIQCDRPAEKIVEIQKRLNDTGLNTDTVEDILQRSLINGKTNLAVDLMDIIRKEGNTVAHEDIISLSRNFVKGKDGEGLYDVAREITKTLDGDRQAISLYLNVVRELLKQEPLDTIVERLKEVGVGEEVIKMLSIAARMSEVPVSEVVRDAEPEDIKPSIIKLDVFNIIRGSNGSAEEIMLLIDTLNRSSRDQMVQIQSIVLLRCLQSLAMSDEECKKLVDLMHERQLGIMRPMQDNILMQVDKMNLSPEIVNEIKTKLQELYSLKIESVSRIVKPEDMRQMSIEDLEKLQREQKRKGFNNKSTQKRLLIAHCKEGNIAEADKIMDSLKQQGFIFDAETLRQLLMYFAEHKQDVKEAERHLELLESQYPDFWQYTGALIHMARLYLRQNNLEAAKELLKSRAMKHQEKYDAEFRTCFVLGRRLQDLLTDAANNCGGKAAQELLPILFESGYIKEGSYDLIKMPVESCIRKGDFDGALDNLEHTLKEYNRVPGFSAIFIHFIKEENSEKLQRAVDLCMSSNLDQFSVLHHLMFGFIESGKLKQARNIAETPGLRANMTLLKDHCTRLAVAGKLQQIHDMVEATRNLDGVDKEELHFQLIRANSSKGDWQKALDAYIFMEEEGITPRVRTQRYLANVLQSAGQPVPFQVPEPKQSTNAPGKTSGNEDILEAIKKDDYETLLKLTNKSENTGSQSASAEIASLLVQSKQVRLLKKVVHELAMRGECDKISQIASVPLPVNMKKYCSQKTFLAQITKGTVDKFFEDVQKDLKIFVNSSTGVNMKELLNARPEMLQTVEDLAVKATADPGTYGPLGDLAHALFVLRQDEKFSELIQKYPDVKENLQFQNLTRTLRNQEEDMKRLAEFSQKHLTIGKYKSCMSNLILMRAMENDVDGALKYFEEVQNLGIKPEEMWAKPMMMVETLLRDKGQSLPWPEGTFKPRDQGITSRSSSSSSSSNSSSSSSSSSSNPSSSSDDSSSSDSSDDESSKKRK